MSPAEGRKFAFTLGLAFLALAALVAWRGAATVALVAGGAGALFVVLALAVPGRLSPIYRGWMRFALLLSRVTTPLFMGIVFYLVVLPIGLLRRSFGGNPLIRSPRGESFWIARTETGGRGGMENQF